MFNSSDGRSKFPNARRAQFWEAAKLFISAGFDSRGAISKLGDKTRRFLMDDLRDGGCTSSQLSLIDDIPAR